MSRLTDLLRAAKQIDPRLGEDLEAEIRPLQERLPFGLNFERHAPEAVELAGHKIRKGSKVRVLPPRGSTARGDQRIWVVTSIRGSSAEIATPNGESVETVTVQPDDLILVAEFRDRIYPGLRPDGAVEHGRDKPFHTVINGENFHVLEQLTFTHEQSVDAIYIDPPYNTGARDWKYNNDYVEGDDLYRHSKWLAFMERRLKLAQRLLKPEDSVLIVTIDEKEYLRLGMLLEQTFPNAKVQMVSSVINPKGTARRNEFSRVDEFIYFVMIGEYELARSGSDMLTQKDVSQDTTVRWRGFPRTGRKGRRAVNPGSWYPIYFNHDDDSFHSIGDTVWEGEEPPPEPDGTYAIWPPIRNGEEYSWAMVPATFRRLHAKGAIKFGKPRKGEGTSISYLTNNQLKQIEDGTMSVAGRDNNGSLVVEYPVDSKTTAPKTQWNLTAHEAGANGTNIVRALIPDRRFPFPKSLYAVEDALRFFVSNKPDAVVLDFFAGSGTTAHAVMRLNKQDSGRRQCISVTNNEVSADEQTKLLKRGLRPGDPEWEALGICDYVTKPRIRAAITGKTPKGDPIKGDYRFVDEFPMSDGFEENAAFFTLTYQSPWRVSTDRAFAAIAPMLWLRAGALGRRIESVADGWDVADSYGIINDLDKASGFVAALENRDGISIAYIVTDDEGRYQQVANEIPEVQTVRLYEDYLRNCEMTGDF